MEEAQEWVAEVPPVKYEVGEGGSDAESVDVPRHSKKGRV